MRCFISCFLLLGLSVVSGQDSLRYSKVVAVECNEFAMFTNGSGDYSVGKVSRVKKLWESDYSIDSIAIGDLLIDAAGMIFEIRGTVAPGADSRQLSVDLLMGQMLPRGRGAIWRPDTLGMIPVPPAGSVGISSKLFAAIINHNFKIRNELGDGVPGPKGDKGDKGDDGVDGVDGVDAIADTVFLRLLEEDYVMETCSSAHIFPLAIYGIPNGLYKFEANIAGVKAKPQVPFQFSLAFFGERVTNGQSRVFIETGINAYDQPGNIQTGNVYNPEGIVEFLSEVPGSITINLVFQCSDGDGDSIENEFPTFFAGSYFKLTRLREQN